MNKAIINAIVFGVVFGAFFYYMDLQAKKQVSPSDSGELVFEYPRIYRVFAILCVLIGLIPLIPITQMILANEYKIFPLIITLFLLFTIGGIFFIKETFFTRIITSEYKLTYLKRKKSIEIEWKDIKKVKMNVLSGYLTVSDDRNKIKCHMHLVGFNDLVRHIHQKTGISILSMGIKNIK